MAILGILALVAVLFFAYQFVQSVRNGHGFASVICIFWAAVAFIFMVGAFKVAGGYSPTSGSSSSYRTYASSTSTSSSSKSTVTKSSTPETNAKVYLVSEAEKEKKTEAPAKEEPETEKAKSVYKPTYVLNTNTKKFHRSSCHEVKKIADKNKQTYTGDRKDVIARGYSPCKKCNP